MAGVSRASIGTLALLLIAPTGSATAQDFRFGAKVGVPVTSYFETGQAPVRGGVIAFTSETRRYTLGPSVEWRLTPRFGLEFDALYKRAGYVRTENTTVSGVTIDSSVEVTGNSWDVPMMAKYRWEGPVAPYVAGGFVLRYMGLGPNDTEENVPVFVPGATVGVGVEFGPTRIRLLPELRYSRWRSTIISSPGPLRLESNQIEFLLGFLF